MSIEVSWGGNGRQRSTAERNVWAAVANSGRSDASPASYARAIGWWRWLQWASAAGCAASVAAFLWLMVGGQLTGVPNGGVVCALFVLLIVAKTARRHVVALRRAFIRHGEMPAYLERKLAAELPGTTHAQRQQVWRGLRQFFMAYSACAHQPVGMPSKAVDAAWHVFLLDTSAYAKWCSVAFGRMLHHSPAEVMAKSAKRNDALRRTWFWACQFEGLDAEAPSRIPLLFDLDRNLQWAPDAAPVVTYTTDERQADRLRTQGSGGTVLVATLFASSAYAGSVADFGRANPKPRDTGGTAGGCGSFNGSDGGGDGGGDGCGGGGCGGD